MAYDIIGDLHGHHDQLVALLRKLGYVERHKTWQHPSRTAIFVGDFIDRGTGQVPTLDIVRAMVKDGCAHALMGNHEFNAIAYWTQDPDNVHRHLRVRSAKNTAQHQAFLTEVPPDSALHQAYVDWFYSLPLWLELPGLRVVHACWHPAHMQRLAPHLGPGHTLTESLVVAASRKGRPEYEAIEALLKGLEIDLPDGVGFVDPNGLYRTRVRTKWWLDGARSYRDAALLGDELRRLLPDAAIADSLRLGYADRIPLFFGHYWHTGTPAPLTPHIACVDYSVGNGGPLVAYRWDGEEVLSPRNFCSTAARR